MSKPENSERENFLTRWSSRKLANRAPPARQDAHSGRELRDAKGTSENDTLAKTSKDGDAQDNPPHDVALTSFLNIMSSNNFTSANATARTRRAWRGACRRCIIGSHE